eukprot:TRINITY_DN5382_c1_g1_i5.p2 TRINITY_DN5382_c1_g1~~TRINITY_DN5382_c1_g1_i5.p2  ORF type:complete len:211 (-),score=33.47 TRINITY_DN5382_c1_g1_i5:51-683(-)
MYLNTDFHNGITNGVAWYPLFGGMQDWNYVWQGCMETTIEVSCQKWPPMSEILEFWNDNSESLISYLENVHVGFRGFVKDTSGNPIRAAVTVVGRNFTVHSEAFSGKYFRIVLPGKYTVVASAPGHLDQIQGVEVLDSKPYTYVVVNFTLVPLFTINEENHLTPEIPLNPEPVVQTSAFLSLQGVVIVLVLVSIGVFAFLRYKKNSRFVN